MNRKFSSLLRKTFFLIGAVSLGWIIRAQAQSTTPADTTQRQGMHHRWGNRNGGDSLNHAFRNGGDRGDHRDFAHRGTGRPRWVNHESIRYTPEQRKQVAEINKDYRQKSSDLFKKDNITLGEYKASLLALQKEKKSRLEALLTQKQKDELAARRKRQTENMQVMAAARMERLKLRLNLSDDQVTKIKAGQQDLHDQLKAIHENPDLLPQQKMDQLKTLMAKRNDTYKSVLTPEQYSQFEQMSRRRDGFGGPRGFGGHRGAENPDSPGRPGGSDGHPEWQDRS